MEHIVGIGGSAISNSSEDVIKTFALSTCVGLVFYSARHRCMGMAHIQLPNSRAMRADDIPSRFADSAPGYLFQQMQQKYGVTKGSLLISLYGGIDPRSEADCFRIGEKNLKSVREALSQLGLMYSDVDTGGLNSRTLIAYVSTGIVEVIRRPMTIAGMFVPPKNGAR